MNLNEYPAVIAKVQLEVANLDAALAQALSIVKAIEAEVDTAIAFDTELKNEAQRKSKRQQLLNEHNDYWEEKEFLAEWQSRREFSFVELCRLRNEFSVLKLEKRHVIAELENQTAM